jgi:TPR repeat protein
MEREHWQPAVAELRRALELSPSNAVVHFHLAKAFGGAGDHAKSIEHMEAALRLDRGEIPKEVRRETAAQLTSMKTLVRDTAGDPSARSEMQTSAEAGDLIAQIGMANACFAAHQYEEGLAWEAKAARQGNAQAQYDYAKNLCMVRPDAGKEAVQWLTRAANQGHTQAQFHLGKFLYDGKVVPPDKVAAGKWIFLVAGVGDKDAQHLWREMELFLSSAELAEARKAAADFKPVSEERAGGRK